MSNDIIVDVGYNETRVALLENKDLVEIYVERAEKEEIVGNIYRGRVENVLPGMQAAFINIGIGKNAFLYLGDARQSAEDDESGLEDVDGLKDTGRRTIKPGEEITVQVIKEGIGTKGPRVSTNITLPGRGLVMMPRADYAGVSRRIEDEQERARLKSIAEKLKPDGMGLIVRTVGEGMKEEDFAQDIDFLTKLWKKIEESEKTGPVPRMIHKDFSITFRMIRDAFTPAIDKFIINDKKQYERILELIDIMSPSLKSKIKYFDKKDDIFEYYGIESGISKALSRKVWLRCGGYIVIDQTEALTSIDVNTGKFIGNCALEDTILKTNMEASKEIAKQLRLRDIGGIIIIDFIDMHVEENKQAVLESLKNCLRKDRTKTTVIGFTELGLVEMTRKKVRHSLSSVMNVECTCCEGSGKVLSPSSIARRIEKRIIRFIAENPVDSIEVEVNPDIMDELLGNNGRNIERMQEEYGKKIDIKASRDLKHNDVRINHLKNP